MTTAVDQKHFTDALARIVRIMPTPARVAGNPNLGEVQVIEGEGGVHLIYASQSLRLEGFMSGVSAQGSFMVDGRALLAACKSVKDLPALSPRDGVLLIDDTAIPVRLSPSDSSDHGYREVAWGELPDWQVALAAGMACAGGKVDGMDYGELTFAKLGSSLEVTSTNRYIAASTFLSLSGRTDDRDSFRLRAEDVKAVNTLFAGEEVSLKVLYLPDSTEIMAVLFEGDDLSLRVEAHRPIKPAPNASRLFERNEWLIEVAVGSEALRQEVAKIYRSYSRSEAGNQLVTFAVAPDALRLTCGGNVAEVEAHTDGVKPTESFDLYFNLSALHDMLKGLPVDPQAQVTFDFLARTKEMGRTQPVRFRAWPVSLLIMERDPSDA